MLQILNPSKGVTDHQIAFAPTCEPGSWSPASQTARYTSSCIQLVIQLIYMAKKNLGSTNFLAILAPNLIGVIFDVNWRT